MYLCRYSEAERGARIGVVRDGEVYDVTERWPTMADFLRWSVGHGAGLGEALVKLTTGAAPVGRMDAMTQGGGEGMRLLKPTDAQEVWAAGVTYERSRVAREEESAGSGIYDRVYTAPRPEIFFKATPSRTVGPGEPVAVRADSRWNVPEPELGLVVNPALELVGFTVGNDMSSRDIEGENPLYLPQAKMYGACCALGPVIACCDAVPDPKALTVRLTIERGGERIFGGEVSTAKIVRAYDELIGYLGRDNLFPDGAVLLTGTGIVPPDDVTLEDGDVVTIAIDGIGELRNPVVRGYHSA
jgi:2-dehydro-3-deoxy-D-arabinonate dehydratase